MTILRHGLESLADKNVFIEFGEAFTDDELVIEGGGDAYRLRCQERRVRRYAVHLNVCANLCANLSEKLLEVEMQTEEENLLVRREIGDAVLAVLEQGKVVSVESIITYLERQHYEVTLTCPQD